MNRINWKYTRCFLGPLDETNMITVKAIFHACPRSFLFIFQPIKIDMIDHAAGKTVLIYDRKSWTSNNVLYAFHLAKRMYKCRFAAAHGSMKSNHFFIIRYLPKPEGSAVYFL